MDQRSAECLRKTPSSESKVIWTYLTGFAVRQMTSAKSTGLSATEIFIIPPMIKITNNNSIIWV